MSAVPKRKFGTLNSEGVFSLSPLIVGMDLYLRASVVDKFGKNDDIGTTFEPVSIGGSSVLLSSAETLDIVSDDANDTILGTGAQKILIQGLDANFVEQDLEIDMNGTTPVTTTGTTWLRFPRAKVTQVGSDASSTNIGEITVSASTTTTATMIILAAEGQSQTAQYTIPAAKTGYFENIFFTSDSTNVLIAQLQVRPFGEGWQTKHELVITNEHVGADMSGSGAIPEKSDVRWIAKGSNPNNAATGGFKIILIDNDTKW